MDKPGFAEFWDAMYRRNEHLEYWEESAVSRDFLDTVAGLGLAPDSRVLDLGCGTGLEACSLALQGLDVCGIDVSPGAISLARERAATSGAFARFTVGSVLQLPYPESSFELLTDRGCLHLIPHSKWGNYAAEAARVLVDGGYLLIRACSDAANRDFSHLDEARLLEVFFPAGFEQVSTGQTRLENRRGGLQALQALLRRAGSG